MKLPACKKCDSTQVEIIGKRNALYPVGCLYFIGLPVAQFHQLQSPIDFQCKKCGQRLSKRTGLAKASIVFMIIFALALTVYYGNAIYEWIYYSQY